MAVTRIPLPFFIGKGHLCDILVIATVLRTGVMCILTRSPCCSICLSDRTSYGRDNFPTGHDRTRKDSRILLPIQMHYPDEAIPAILLVADKSVPNPPFHPHIFYNGKRHGCYLWHNDISQPISSIRCHLVS